jgi:hypothetical protein
VVVHLLQNLYHETAEAALIKVLGYFAPALTVPDWDSGNDLSPGSSFLTNLNSNQQLESNIYRYSIWGREDYPQLFHIAGYALIPDWTINGQVIIKGEDVLSYVLEAIRIASEIQNLIAIADEPIIISNYNFSVTNYYYYNDQGFYYMDLYYQTGNPYYYNQAYNSWGLADYYQYMSIYWNYEWLFAADMFDYSGYMIDKIDGLSDIWNNDVVGSAENDAVVPTFSQKWPNLTSSNILLAEGANHILEVHSSEVRDRINIQATPVLRGGFFYFNLPLYNLSLSPPGCGNKSRMTIHTFVMV